jgi:hypothetical protein
MAHFTYGLLDDGADKTMCNERLLKILNLKGRNIDFEVTTMTSPGSSMHGKDVDLAVSSVNGESKVSISNVWTVKNLPISTRCAAPKCHLNKYDYLSDLQIPEIENDDVMLLIGTDAPFAHIPLTMRTGNNSQPYAVCSCVGWTVRGPMEIESECNTATINFQSTKDEVLQQQLERMWTTDFNDMTSKKHCAMSLKDKQELLQKASEVIEALSVKREEDMQDIREEMEKEVCDMKEKLEEEVESKKKAVESSKKHYRKQLIS